MPETCHLSLAGIRMEVRSECPLGVSPSFAPFLTEPGETELRAEFWLTEALPPVPEKCLSFEMGRKVCVTDEGELLRFFYDHDSPGPYAVARWSDPRTIRVSYLESGKHAVTELSNAFYHLAVEQLLIRHDRLCFHAACVETSAGGILFTGPSGIGKSTQAENWCRFRSARQINGDRPALSFDGQGWLAWGMPYAGSSRVWVNDCCPIAAIVALRQEKQCSLRRLNPGEAFRALWTGLAVHHWDRDFVEKASALAMELIASVPVYEFGCTPDEAAVSFLEKELRKDGCL